MTYDIDDHLVIQPSLNLAVFLLENSMFVLSLAMVLFSIFSFTLCKSWAAKILSQICTWMIIITSLSLMLWMCIVLYWPSHLFQLAPISKVNIISSIGATPASVSPSNIIIALLLIYIGRHSISCVFNAMVCNASKALTTVRTLLMTVPPIRYTPHSFKKAMP